MLYLPLANYHPFSDHGDPYSPPDVEFLPDLTHPHELIEFGDRLLKLSGWAIIFGLLGLAIIALVNWSLPPDYRSRWLERWLPQVNRSFQVFKHSLFVLWLLIPGFFLCSTLANRYHHWEQDAIDQIAGTVAGARLEHLAPQLRYEVEVPYTSYETVDGELVEVERLQTYNRFLGLSGSQIEVTVEQVKDPASDRLIYQSRFQADYQVTNSLGEAEDFFFEAPPPRGYSLLQDYRVEREQERLQPINPGDYGFPIPLKPGESTQFRVTYEAQGGSRWVYDSRSQLLSDFRLTVKALFANADFASGIIPTTTQKIPQGTQFTWDFADNVSVRNPFGVFTATRSVKNTGILPRLLLLAPAICLWWLLLLYFSVPLRLRDVAIAAGLFFACILSLTYLSRLGSATVAWAMVLPILLLLAAGLGRGTQGRAAIVLVTISGVGLPVLALLIPYSGLTLSGAGLLSIAWIVLRHWYAKQGGRKQGYSKQSSST